MTHPDPPAGSGSPPPSTRWRHHRQRTKQAIEDASLRLFAEKGFEETTVDELAAAAGVARRTVFRYFPSKNDVVYGAIEERLALLRRELTSASPGTPPVDVVHAAFRAVNDYEPSEYPSLRTRLRLLTTVPALKAHTLWRYGEWEDEVRRALLERLGPGRALYADSLARASLAVLWAAFDAWLDAPTDTDLLAGIDTVFDLLRNGFVPPEVSLPPTTASMP